MTAGIGNTDPVDSDPKEIVFGSALILAITGLVIAALLVVLLVLKDWKAADVATVVGLFTSVVGTLVGAFLGVQVGSAGRQKAEDIAQKALAALPPEKANEIVGSRPGAGGAKVDPASEGVAS